MNKLVLNPTIFIIGLNRSGTTAFVQSFLNHPEIEVFKDPGKYKYEATGVIDFSHFFAPPVSRTTKARVIKQSIGQYTVELCTIPLYPMLKNRPAFIKQLHSVFLIRKPSAIWNSWETMTQWLKTTEEPYIKNKWKELTIDKGIQVGWGDFSLFRLAYLYFHETFKYVQRVAPSNTSVVALEDLVNENSSKKILANLCNKINLEFNENMINWKIRFGETNARLVDGFNRDLSNIERQFIHRNVRNSSGFRKIDSELVISERMEKRIDNGELGKIHDRLLRLSHVQFQI